VPGSVERSLQMLWVVDAEMIRRAGTIDRAGERLVVEAATEQGRRTEPLAELATAVQQAARHGRAPGDRGGITETQPGQVEREPE
jgi:hypothetical protein